MRICGFAGLSPWLRQIPSYLLIARNRGYFTKNAGFQMGSVLD
jgi:hypothetical protein